MRMKDIALQDIIALGEKMHNARRITVTAHVRPDGDAIGSTSAMLLFLKEIYGRREVRVLLCGECPANLEFIIPESCKGDFMFLTDDFSEASEWVGGSDLVLLLDCNGFYRVEGLEEDLRRSDAFKVMIDHHLHPQTELFDLVFSQPWQSSTCELLYHLFMRLPETGGDPLKLPRECAEALLSGLTTDTNNFANSVIPSTYVAASGLIRAGADRDRILDHLYFNYPEGRIRLIGHLLANKLHITPSGVAYMVCGSDDMKRFGLKDGDTEGFVNMPLAAGNVKMSVFAKADGEFYRVSIRSKKGISARDFAEEWFGGGGHELAAGGKIRMNGAEDEKKAHEYIEKAISAFIR